MADLDDVQNYGRKFENQRKKLAEADINDADRDAIQAFVRHRDTTESVNTGTIVSDLNHLRLSAERATTPLTEMDHEEVDKLLFSLKHDYELKPGTLRNYRKKLRVFFRWFGKEWADDITIGGSPDRNVDPPSVFG